MIKFISTITTQSQIFLSQQKSQFNTYLTIIQIPMPIPQSLPLPALLTLLARPSSFPHISHQLLLSLSRIHSYPPLFQLAVRLFQINSAANSSVSFYGSSMQRLEGEAFGLWDEKSDRDGKKWMDVENYGEKLLQALREIEGNNESLAFGNFYDNLIKFLPQSALTCIREPEKKEIKQLYVSILEKIIFYQKDQIVQQKQMTKNCPLFFTNLFPHALFNLTDQPLLKNVAKNWIIPNLPYNNVIEVQKGLIWLSRFNLESKPFVEDSLGRISLKLSSDQDNCIEKLCAINSLYLITRKIYPHSPHWAQQARNIVTKSHFCELIVDHPEELLLQILANVKKQSQKSKQKIQQISYNLLKERSSQEIVKELDEQYLQQSILIKFIRLYFLYAFTSPQNDIDSILRIKNAFSNQRILNFLSNNPYSGDLSAEVLYLHKYTNQTFNENIFSHATEYFEKLQKQIVPEYNRILTMKEQKMLETFSNVICGKMEHFQSKFMSQKLEVYREKDETDGKVKDQEKILISLLNDNEFLGSRTSGNFRQIVRRKLTQNIRNRVNKPEQIYPFFPDLSLRQPTSSTGQLHLYLASSLHKRSRVPQHAQILHHSETKKNMEILEAINTSKFQNWSGLV